MAPPLSPTHRAPIAAAFQCERREAFQHSRFSPRQGGRKISLHHHHRQQKSCSCSSTEPKCAGFKLFSAVLCQAWRTCLFSVSASVLSFGFLCGAARHCDLVHYVRQRFLPVSCKFVCVKVEEFNLSTHRGQQIFY